MKLRTKYQVLNSRGEVIFYLILDSNEIYPDLFSANLTLDNNVSIKTEIVNSVDDLNMIYRLLLEKSGIGELQQLKNIPVKIESVSSSADELNEIKKHLDIVKKKLLKDSNK
jgi:hypothetical protein